MHFATKFLLRIGVNVLALYLIPLFLPGFMVAAEWKAMLAGAVLLALAHGLLKPLLRLVTFPFIIITFGLFNIVINFVLLVIADNLSPAITIADLKTTFIASIIIGILNSII
ncbi:MAG: phage holin family protein [Candidatus Sungbacteria bacterium]|uniref:Phage holin family protein n=1 Tax=Candidatus Sungiibacteriota bacterium TaxID=2750080 RepID=A0A931SBD1_9BACT|nr:phage holin family protein [Candidatus Sungbacteria bacterium]